MKIPPDVSCSLYQDRLLVEIQQAEIKELSPFSWCLWSSAYGPDLLSDRSSRLLWARSYSIKAIKAALGNGEKFYWIIANGKRAGFVSFRWQESTRMMQLCKLYLHPDYWGKGYGARVLGRITFFARELGAERMELYVFRRNQRAVAAYMRAGFRIEREELSDLGGGLIYDDFVMSQYL